ncbi:MAG: TrmB family transcriptional regulator [Chloroflexi bacterium]|nr:TrmB family transcriptional regulator [Chloroflexota bacterium]
MNVIERLQVLGFSEYEAKAYIALLRKSPVTGYELSKLSGIPRSMIYEVLGRLGTRGAVLSTVAGGTTRYMPVPADELLDRLHENYHAQVEAVRRELDGLTPGGELDYVWNLEGYDNIIARAREMIGAAEERLHLALLPETFPDLAKALAEAAERGVHIIINTTKPLDFSGGRVAVTPLVADDAGQEGTLGLMLVVDGREALISERLEETDARASWTRNPLMTFVVEHHMRIDMYMPHIVALLGDRLLEVMDDLDRDLLKSLLPDRQEMHGQKVS